MKKIIYDTVGTVSFCFVIVFVVCFSLLKKHQEKTTHIKSMQNVHSSIHYFLLDASIKIGQTNEQTKKTSTKQRQNQTRQNKAR
jgi:cell shape-determining protein MreC